MNSSPAREHYLRLREKHGPMRSRVRRRIFPNFDDVAPPAFRHELNIARDKVIASRLEAIRER